MHTGSAPAARGGRNPFARASPLRQNRPPVTSIRVAILAAGRGNRLAPLTDDRPKCLLPIDGVSPLHAMLEALDRAARVDEVVIVVGHAAARIDEFLAGREYGFATRTLVNPRFDTANNIVSAKLLADSCRGGFLLVNSDVVCDPAIVADALGHGTFLCVDASRPIRGEAMKVRFDGERLVAIGKHLDPETADGEYIGLARFDAAGADAFFAAVDEVLEAGGDGEWYEAAIGRAARRFPIAARFIDGRPWIEIDDHDDLERARSVVLPSIRRVAAC